MSGVVPALGSAVARNEQAFDLERHEAGLLQVIESMGLPTTGVLVPVEERVRLFQTIAGTLVRLPGEHLARSVYLSKFLAAVASGLFDAALNYLWDETVGELRRRVATYDLEYFYDVAVGGQPERRKKLSGEEDLSKVEDQELITAAQKMGLVSDVGFKQLDLVRYMRNHASAAHPNQVDLRALQLLEYLETCIVEVITLPETNVVTQIRRLLANVKENKIDASEAGTIGRFYNDLANEQATNLGNGFFGIYTATATDAQTRTNIRLLLPALWALLEEDARRGFGVKYARFVANGDQQQAEWARELLDVVDAQSYLPEGVRVAELDVAIDALVTAHHGFNNFHAEPAPARVLRKLVGAAPNVPAANRRKYVHALVDAYLGNGYGVSNAAEPIYRDLIEAFTTDEALEALIAFTDPTIASTLQFDLSQRRWRTLLELLRPRVVGRRALDLLAALDEYGGPMQQASRDSSIRRLVAPLVAR
jgi:hypothetical protein